MKKIKRMIALVMSLMLMALLFTETAVFAAAEPSQQYEITEETVTLHGKYTEEKGGYSFTYGSAGISANFTGTEFWIYVPEAPEQDGSVKNVGVSVLVDSEMAMDAHMYNIDKTGWHCVASGLEKGDHHIEVRKQSRNFYGIMASDWFVVSKIGVNNGGKINAPTPLSDLVIEVYGDSISNGDAVWLDEEGILGTAGSNHAYTFGNYTGVLERLLDAEVRVCGNSGNGLCGWVMAEGGNGEVENLLPPQKCWSVIDSQHGNKPYAHTGKNIADVVIVNLGTNDRVELGGGDLTDTAFEDEYIRFIKEVKTDCPDVVFICTVGAMGDLKGNNYEVDFDRITSEANTWAGEEFCYFVPLQHCGKIKNGKGYDGGHPSNTAHEVYGLQLATLINKRLSLGKTLPTDIPDGIYEGPFEEDLSKANGVVYIDGEKTLYGGMSKYGAFDSDSSTAWQIQDYKEMASGNCWLGVEFAEAKNFSQVEIVWEDGTRPRDNQYKVQYFSEGQWVDVQNATYTMGEKDGDTRTSRATFDRVSATQVRVIITGSVSDADSNESKRYAAKIFEMSVVESIENYTGNTLDYITGKTDNLTRVTALVNTVAPAALTVKKAYATEDGTQRFIATNIYDYSVPAGKIIKVTYTVEREGQQINGTEYIYRAYSKITLGEEEIDIQGLTGQINGYVTGILFKNVLSTDTITVDFELV